MIIDPSTLREIQHRDELPDFLNRHGLIGHGAEIGTHVGEFALTILGAWNGQRLNLIDPYQHFPPGEYVDGSAINHQTGSPLDFEALFYRAHCLLNPFPASFFIRQTSVEATSMFVDESLDFVFVDANHAPKHAVEDIAIWWPKVKTGGILALHDCYTRNDWKLICGVFDAVMDHAEKIGQRPHVTYCTTAWFLKT